MKNSSSNSRIRILYHLEDSNPEFWNVFLDFAGTELWSGCQPNVIIFVGSIRKNFINICSIPDLLKGILFLIWKLSSLFLICLSFLFHLQLILIIIWYNSMQFECKRYSLINSIIKRIIKIINSFLFFLFNLNSNE